jgi:hypothetical protein
MTKYYCPYCPDIFSCMHDLRYIEESSINVSDINVSDINISDINVSDINISEKRKNLDADEDIIYIAYKFKKIKLAKAYTKKISSKRKIDENYNDNNLKRLKRF